MYIYIESHVNGALTPFKHPAFHVKVSIYMEIGTVRPGGADAPPLELPLVYFSRTTDRTLPALSVTWAGTGTEGPGKLPKT